MTHEELLNYADRAILETVYTFIDCPLGFRGDTGIRDYLYHRILSHLENENIVVLNHQNNLKTFLTQSEWNTSLLYKGEEANAPSRGRFDIGILNPEAIKAGDQQVFIAFECGRNKPSSKLLTTDIDGLLKNVSPLSLDINKIFRELYEKKLSYGYLLEFYDNERNIDDIEQIIENDEHFRQLNDQLRTIILKMGERQGASIQFYPESWKSKLTHTESELLKQILNLVGERKKQPAIFEKTDIERFCIDCSQGGVKLQRALLALKQELPSKLADLLKLQYPHPGKENRGRTMTVNHTEHGILFRITNHSLGVEKIQEIHPQLQTYFKELIHNDSIIIPRSIDEKFIQKVVSSLTAFTQQNTTIAPHMTRQQRFSHNCNPCGQELQKRIYQKFSSNPRVKLLYGQGSVFKSMTVNYLDRCLLRIHSKIADQKTGKEKIVVTDPILKSLLVKREIIIPVSIDNVFVDMILSSLSQIIK